MSAGAAPLEPRVERQSVRQCPSCRRTWPVDWDYCPDCVIWLVGTERLESVTRLVPARSSGPPVVPDATLVACEIRCDTEAPTREQLRVAREAMEAARRLIAARGGTAHAEAGAGLIAGWPEEAGVDPALDAVSAIQAARSAGPGRQPLAVIALGLGVVARAARSTAETRALARRLASLARADRALLCECSYERGVDRFDFRGVVPVVPRSAPLPGIVFELLGRKPERSGTHHTGPERLPLVGRREVLEALDLARHDAAGCRSVVLHLVGEPGLGKSKVVREWLAARQSDGTLSGWLRLQVHGVPYGNYRLRGWNRLVAPLGASPAEPAHADEAARAIVRKRRPALIVVDDLHWIDAASREALAALLTKLAHRRVLSILAYRPSFVSEAPTAGDAIHRRLRLSGLDIASMRALVDGLAAPPGEALPETLRKEIVARSGGNPLYAEEAVGHLLAARIGDERGLIGLPPSLPQLLVLRARWTAEQALPEIERELRYERLRGGLGPGGIGGRDVLLGKLDALEEQLAAWLDRFDVVEEQPAPVVREFLERLRGIDGSLALLSLFLGRQRPHHHRLAQALRRLTPA